MRPNNTGKFCLRLTKLEISILKAALDYYQLADEFGYGLWGTIPGATFGSSDSEYMFRSGHIYQKLKELSKVKPDYGFWYTPELMAKLFKKEYRKAKWRGEEEEREMRRKAEKNDNRI